MKKISLGIFVFILFYSCSSEDVKISENYIEKFEIAEINPIEINIKNNQSLIYIWTNSVLYEDLKKQVPHIKVSEGALLTKSEAYSSYTVTAENGKIREYTVEIDTTVPRMFSFEYWNLSEGNLIYYIPSSLKWASGNAGIGLALTILKIDAKNPENYPTKKTEDGYKGNAVVMETIKGGDVFGRDVRLISGNFFLGKFNATKAIYDELEATELGYIYPAKPKSIKGHYKYNEGHGAFIGFDNPLKQDSCNMNAWVYKSENDTTLTVRNIDSTDLVIAKAVFNCSDTGGKFKDFEAIFNYTSEPDFENFNYKLGVTFSASKDGAYYAGKIGSKLIVDEIEITDYEE